MTDELPRKIVIPGGSGQLGNLIARTFHNRGDAVVVLSRRPTPAPWRVVGWDANTVDDWAAEIDGADVVVNLAGRSVNCRYNPANRRAILDSRVRSTKTIGEAIARSVTPPKVWLQAGTSTIYGHRSDAPNDETTGIIGSGGDAPEKWRFSEGVAKAWEKAFEECSVVTTRKVMLRSSMVMSPDPGGVFDVLLGLVRRGLGGRNGDGRQYVSWIHDGDFLRAIDWLIAHDEVEGPINLTSPHPLPNALFMKELREAWGAKLGLASTRLMLEIGAIFLRTESELILKSRRVIPGHLLDQGFTFQFPTWRKAAAELSERWRTTRGR